MFSLNEILPNERKEEGKSLTDKYKLYSTEYLEHLKDEINKNCKEFAIGFAKVYDYWRNYPYG